MRRNERERGIITTITLPPWDRFREEKGEEEDGEKKKKMAEMVWRSRTRKKGWARETEMCPSWASRIIPVARRNDIRSLLFRREFYALRIILTAPRQKERSESNNRNDARSPETAISLSTIIALLSSTITISFFPFSAGRSDEPTFEKSN